MTLLLPSFLKSRYFDWRCLGLVRVHPVFPTANLARRYIYPHSDSTETFVGFLPKWFLFCVLLKKNQNISYAVYLTGLYLTTRQTVHNHQSVTDEPVWIIKITVMFSCSCVCDMTKHQMTRRCLKNCSHLSSAGSLHADDFRELFPCCSWISLLSGRQWWPFLFHHFSPDWNFSTIIWLFDKSRWLWW